MNDDPRADARWLSYGELATARGISRSSAIRMARRHGWKRQTGNDGTARVAVPLAALEGKPKPNARAIEDVTEGGPDGSPPGQNSIIRVLEDQIADLRVEGDLANDRSDRAEHRAARAEARLDQVLADLRNERAASADERRRLLERIAELEALLAKQSEAEPPGPAVDAISAELEQEGPLPPAWLEEAWGADASDDQSATANPAHQVERLWQRIEELEARLTEQTVPAPESELSDEVLAAISADLEQDAPLEEAAEERPEAGQGTTIEAVPTEPPATNGWPRRWWRRLLRRRAASEG